MDERSAQDAQGEQREPDGGPVRPDVPELVARAQQTADEIWEEMLRLARTTGTEAGELAELRLEEAIAGGRLLYREMRDARTALDGLPPDRDEE